jgi:hypothetical protein
LRGYEFWDDWQKTGDNWILKESIFWIHHGVELALKQLLVQKDEFLVFEDVDAAVTALATLRKKQGMKNAGVLELFEHPDGVMSVSFQKLLERCAVMLNLTELAEGEPLRSKIEELGNYRNQITHFAVKFKVGYIANLLADILNPLLTILAREITDKDFLNNCLPQIKQKAQSVRIVNEVFEVPPSSDPLFTGREVPLQQLHEAQRAHQSVALTGVEGMGKSRTAIQYAHQHSQDYRYVLWVEAGNSVTNFFNNVAALTGKLDLPEKNNKVQKRISAVRNWLRDHTDWLLIINDANNANDLTKIEQFIPKPMTGNTLFTTREQPTFTHIVALDEMGIDESALLLLRCAKLISSDIPPDKVHEVVSDADWEMAKKIAQQIGGIPLNLRDTEFDIHTEGLTGYFNG